VSRRALALAFAAGLALAGALPAAALGLAGGATGSGGGGGGGSSGGGGGFSGGGGSGGGEWSGPWWAGVLIFLGPWVLIGAIFVVTARLGRGPQLRITRRAKEASGVAEAADLGDGYWHPQALKARVREAFFPIQESWERRDVTASRPFVSDPLYERHRLQLEGLEAQHRVNRIQDLTLHEVEIVRVHNVSDDGEDRFVAYIKCSARDWMEDTQTGAFVNGNKTSATTFEQLWSFARHPEHGWVLDEIQQASEGGYHLTAKLVNADEGPVRERDEAGTAPVADPAPG
jgi:hypothetical protein